MRQLHLLFDTHNRPTVTSSITISLTGPPSLHSAVEQENAYTVPDKKSKSDNEQMNTHCLAANIICAFLSLRLASLFSGLSSQTAFPPIWSSDIGGEDLVSLDWRL
jgi:hypothetical protein